MDKTALEIATDAANFNIQMAAALAEYWQPIMTAPETNALSEILLSDGRGVYVGFRDRPGGKWLDGANHDGYVHAELEPTHWMPLPKAPKLKHY